MYFKFKEIGLYMDIFNLISITDFLVLLEKVKNMLEVHQVVQHLDTGNDLDII